MVRDRFPKVAESLTASTEMLLMLYLPVTCVASSTASWMSSSRRFQRLPSTGRANMRVPMPAKVATPLVEAIGKPWPPHLHQQDRLGQS